MGCKVGLGSFVLGRESADSPFKVPALCMVLLVLLLPGVTTWTAVPGLLSLLLPVSLQQQVLGSGKCVRKETRVSFNTAQVIQVGEL